MSAAMDLVLIFGLGLLLGMQHATDADHLAAVATLSGHEHSLPRALRLGAAWGLGHTVTLLVAAGALAGLGWAIAPHWAVRFEQAVGLLLVVLGARLAWRLRKEGIHFHGHAHPGQGRHFHGHSHATPAAPAAGSEHSSGPHLHPHRTPAAALLVGVVHGLAGTAALTLLAAGTLPSPAMQLAYIAIFGIGSLAGMALLTGTLAMTLRLTAQRLTVLHRSFNVAVAFGSVALGLHLVWSPT
jgi:hypothetical protein